MLFYFTIYFLKRWQDQSSIIFSLTGKIKCDKNVWFFFISKCEICDYLHKEINNKIKNINHWEFCIYTFIIKSHLLPTVLYRSILTDSLCFYRFRAGDWTRYFLQDRALHTPVLLLLREHCSLPAGHHGGSHAHLEHPTPAGRLPRSTGYNLQSLAGFTFSSASRQRLRRVAVLRPHKRSQDRGLRTEAARLCS